MNRHEFYDNLNKYNAISHSGNYKYYNKIDLPDGSTRYFYTKAEWDAYNKEVSSKTNINPNKGSMYEELAQQAKQYDQEVNKDNNRKAFAQKNINNRENAIKKAYEDEQNRRRAEAEAKQKEIEDKRNSPEGRKFYAEKNEALKYLQEWVKNKKAHTGVRNMGVNSPSVMKKITGKIKSIIINKFGENCFKQPAMISDEGRQAIYNYIKNLEYENL